MMTTTRRRAPRPEPRQAVRGPDIEWEHALVRPARPDEAAALSALALRSKAHWGYSPEFMLACREELTLSGEQVEDPTVTVTAAEIEGRIAGFYVLKRLSRGEFELEALFVEPAEIGRGVGRELIEHSKSSARALGGRLLRVTGDPHAERFYRAAGGQIVSQQPSQSIPGRTLPVFVITLCR